MALIEIADLSYSYPGGRRAVHDVSCRVESGEFVLLAGPSGSGKSTLLRALNGLVPHFTGGDISGRVIINGADAITAGPRLLSRHVGLVAQSPEAQMVVDQVEAEIAFALENAAIPESEMRLRVEEVLELLDLTPLRARTITTLSGGERQRVAIAAALALRPQILLLDEPTSQLDPQSAEDVLNALVRLNHDLGLTIILAEHRLERVLRHVDRLTYLEEGTIAADGPVRETLASLPVVPPLIQLAKEFGWRPIPLTVKEARRFLLPGAPQNPGEDQAGAAPQIPSEPEEIVLAVDRLTFSYNGHPALREISLQLRKGEVVALVGRNGSGKTTLLKCIVGLLKRRNGEIRVAGRSTQGRDVADICREVAYLPQDPDDLLFAETVKEEMDITLRNHRLKPAPGEIERLLIGLGLAEVAEAYPRDLSVGQRQRVALGAVTVTRPPLILLDEPTRGLDAGAKAALAGIWRRRRDEGASVLLVTHDVELAASVADRVIVLSQGEIIAEGSAVEVLGASPHFAPEIARLFPGSGWLTVEDARRGLATALSRKE